MLNTELVYLCIHVWPLPLCCVGFAMGFVNRVRCNASASGVEPDNSFQA